MWRAISGYTDCPRVVIRTSGKDIAPARGKGNISFTVRTTTQGQSVYRALTTFKLEGEVTSLSGSSQGEMEDNREKFGDF